MLQNLLAPGCLKGKSFIEMKKELMISPYSPKIILITKRFKCHSLNQHESETVPQFVGELKQLALRCEFRTFLEGALGDLITGPHFGSKSMQIQTKLLAERDS